MSNLELNAEEILESAIEKSREIMNSQPQVAEIILKQLIKCKPDHPEGLQLLGLLEHRLGKHAEAIEIIQVAIEVDPECAENHNNIGLAYACLGEYEKSIEHIEKAVEMKTDHYVFLNNLALQYRQVGRYDESIDTFQKAIDANNTPQIWGNLGGVWGELGNLEKSEECFMNALEIDPNYPAAHVDIAFINHLRGNWEKGFEEYEWRFDHFPQLQFYKKVYDQEKKWDGKANLKGKTIILYGEQGLGDTIQFVRYVKILKEKGCHVIVHCPSSLNAVISRCEGVDEIVNRDIVTGKGDPLPEYDYQCSLLSLPHLLKVVDVGTSPYISPIVTLNTKEQYPDTFNIGICWAGSPAHPKDAERSIKLKHFKPIHDIPNVKLFSLQVDMRKRSYVNTLSNLDLTEDCDDIRIVDMTNMIQTFDDSATIISGLDLVISCDTALVHLAGAMGVPCWALIPYSPDWRWGIEGDKTNWYESLTLIRQKDRGDWTGVFEEVKDRLNKNFSLPEIT